jgi:hypothetical protein
MMKGSLTTTVSKLTLSQLRMITLKIIHVRKKMRAYAVP